MALGPRLRQRGCLRRLQVWHLFSLNACSSDVACMCHDGASYSSYVINKLLGTSWLWDRVRVSGGAYGAFRRGMVCLMCPGLQSCIYPITSNVTAEHTSTISCWAPHGCGSACASAGVPRVASGAASVHAVHACLPWSCIC